MPNRHIAPQLKEFAMRAVDRELLSLQDCVDLGGFSRQTARRLRHEWLGNNDSLAPRKLGSRTGRPHKMTKDAAYHLWLLIRQQRDSHLCELADALVDLGYPRFSLPYLCTAIKRLNITYKLGNCFAAARSDLQRVEYREMIKQYGVEQLVFIDESSFDYRYCNRRRARATRGTYAYLRQPFQRGRRLSFLPACSLASGCFAYYTHSGSFNSDVFLYYLREVLLPHMNRIPLANSVIVCDNASIHKVPQVLDLVRSHDCEIVYLPPYSPDLNPIEKAFNKIKMAMGRTGATPGLSLEEQVFEAADTITPHDVHGWFRFAGLFPPRDTETPS